MTGSEGDARAVTRRRMLTGMAAAALGASLGPVLVACSSDTDPGGGPGEAAPARPFWEVIAEEARTVEPSLAADSAIVELDLDLDLADDLDGPSDALLADLARRSADDFAAGRTMVVTGWLLARTEVLLAIVASEAQR